MQTQTIDGLFLRLSTWPLTDRPTLVMLHGSGGTGVLWQAQLTGLADVANIVAVDLPGHGRSDGPLVGSIEEHAERIARLIGALGLPQAFVCGLSLGGGIALQLLLDHAEVVAGGLLLGTGARLRVMPAMFQLIDQHFEGFVAGLPLVAASPSTDVALLQPLMAATLENGAEVAASDLRLCDDFDVMDRLGEIERPVLVVSGEHDQLTPPKYSRFLAEHIRGAEPVTVPDAGHLSAVERPAVVNQAVHEWLGRRQLGVSASRDQSEQLLSR